MKIQRVIERFTAVILAAVVLATFGIPSATLADTTPTTVWIQWQPIPDSSPHAYTFKISSVSCVTIEELKAAVLRLPKGSHLRWDFGCEPFYHIIRLGTSPPMTIPDFKK